MARTKISEFSATPGNNTDIDGINIAEGCAPSGINDAIRELMSQLKDFQAGTAGDSFNGPVGTTTAAAGAFTTLSASSTVSGTGFSTYLASPPAIGGTAAAAGSFTTLSASSTVTLSGGTANGVLYLNASKVATSGSALTFDGTDLATTGAVRLNNAQYYYGKNAAGSAVRLLGINAGNVNYVGAIDSGPTEVNYGSASSVIAQYWNISGSEQMRLTSTGLGIGTSAPGYKLDVQGTEARVHDSSGTNYVGLNIYSGVTLGGNGSGTRGIQTAATDALTFGVNSTEKMRLDSSGNLGLGVTPSATSIAGVMMQFKGGAVYSSATNNMMILGNAFYNGTNWIYQNSAHATQYIQGGGSGQHQWYVAASGTAGNAISFTQAMTLDASGNLGVGTTSPSNRLDVASSTNSTIGITRTGSHNVTLNAVAGGAFTIGLDGSGGGTERARITSTGDVIIGGVSANGKFMVYDANASIRATAPSGPSIRMYAGTIALLETSTNDDLIIRTNSTERARFDTSGNMLVGTTSAGAGAILDVQSTTKGVRFPNMTTTQKNAITPAAGTVVFDTTLAKLCVYSGSAWQTITSV